MITRPEFHRARISTRTKMTILWNLLASPEAPAFLKKVLNRVELSVPMASAIREFVYNPMLRKHFSH